jgi:hypothetical protein
MLNATEHLETQRDEVSAGVLLSNELGENRKPFSTPRNTTRDLSLRIKKSTSDLHEEGDAFACPVLEQDGGGQSSIGQSGEHKSFMSHSVNMLASTLHTMRMKSVYNARQPAPKPNGPLHERNPREFIAIVVGGSLLSFNAGFINAITLLISGFTVSHVTGSTTKAAIRLYQEEYHEMGELLLLCMCFVGGSSISAMLSNHQTFHLGREYNRIFLLG